jgi:hypothetical protein
MGAAFNLFLLLHDSVFDTKFSVRSRSATNWQDKVRASACHYHKYDYKENLFRTISK